MAKRRAPGTGPTMLQRSRAVSPVTKAEYHMGEGRVDREFFGLSLDDERAITDKVTAVLDKALEA